MTPDASLAPELSGCRILGAFPLWQHGVCLNSCPPLFLLGHQKYSDKVSCCSLVSRRARTSSPMGVHTRRHTPDSCMPTALSRQWHNFIHTRAFARAAAQQWAVGWVPEAVCLPVGPASPAPGSQVASRVWRDPTLSVPLDVKPESAGNQRLCPLSWARGFGTSPSRLSH